MGNITNTYYVQRKTKITRVCPLEYDPDRSMNLHKEIISIHKSGLPEDIKTGMITQYLDDLSIANGISPFIQSGIIVNTQTIGPDEFFHLCRLPGSVLINDNTVLIK